MAAGARSSVALCPVRGLCVTLCACSSLPSRPGPHACIVDILGQRHPGAGQTLMALVWAASRGSSDTVHPPSHAALIAHACVCESALLSLGLAMMAPAWRDISCFGGRVPLSSTPCHRYPDRSRACVRIGAAQLELAMMAPAWRDISCTRAGAAQLPPPLAVIPIAHMLVCLSVLPSVGLTLMAPAWRVISCSRAVAAQLRPA